MAPRQAPMITDTPPTPIDPLDSPIAGRLRSRSQQFLDTLVQEARSRSSSASSRHSRSPDGVKDVLANLGLAAGTVGAEHIKPTAPREEDVLEGVRAFLSGFHNIIRRAKTGLENDVETIQVDDDAQSVNSFHPITEAKRNPFHTFTDEEDEDSGTRLRTDPEQRAASPSHENRQEPLPQVVSMSREESFGEFVMDVFMYEKESGQKLPCRARLDTGMTRNAISHSHAVMLGYEFDEYRGDPCIVADGSLYRPIGQVTLPFHFVSFRTAKTWKVEFIVFPDGSPFDICLGRHFISLADLMKRNPEALPVEFRKLKTSEQRENKHKTHQAVYHSDYTREKEDRRYDDRRTTKPKDKPSKKWY